MTAIGHWVITYKTNLYSEIIIIIMIFQSPTESLLLIMIYRDRKQQCWGHNLKCNVKDENYELYVLNIIKIISKKAWTWFVPFCETQPSLLQIRCTWVSTHIPWILLHAKFITCNNHKKTSLHNWRFTITIIN